MDASPDSLYVHPAGALSPSLWDDDWWEKPDAFKNLNSPVKDELPLGSPESPFPTSSLDASCFPNDDALNWMEKSCDLESLTELHDVSVQDVDQMPVQDLKQPLQNIPKMEDSEFNATASKNQSGVSNNLFTVEGLEDLFHDYIDPQVYSNNKVKEERRVSVDSGISNDDVEDSIFLPATETKADPDISFNKGDDCFNEPVQAPAIIQVLPQPQYQYILPKSIKEDANVLKVIPAGSHQPLLVHPIFVGTHNVSLQRDTKSASSKVQGQVFHNISLQGDTKSASSKVQGQVFHNISLQGDTKSAASKMQGQVLQVAGNIKKDPRPLAQVPVLGRINKTASPYARPPVSKNQVLGTVPKSISIQNFLGSLTKTENLIPLNALLQESNDLIKSSTDVKPSSTVQQPQIVITCDPGVMESPVEIISSVEDNATLVSSYEEDNSTLVSSYDEAMIADTALCSPSMVQASPLGSDISVESPREIEGKFDDGSTYTVSFDGSPSPSSVFEADASPIVSFDECLSPGPSYGGASSSYSEVDQEWSPSMIAASRGRRKIKTTEERKSRKKVQNKEAAIRYRQKKRDEFDLFLQEENGLLEKNKQLKNKCSEVVTEMKYLKGLLRDLYKAKGLIK